MEITPVRYCLVKALSIGTGSLYETGRGSRDTSLKTRWQITIVITFLPGENITTQMVSKGKNFTLRGITSH